MSPFAQALAASPDLFPAALDLRSGVVTLWGLSHEDYARSAFLDGRIAAGKQNRQLPLSELTAAVEAANLRETCDFIFHIGHAGSTLLSRLLGKYPAIFSLREPDVLRTLSIIPEKRRRDALAVPLLKLLSRTYEPNARALVKATSFVSEIASDLLARATNPRALAIGVAPEVYLATIFGGENAPAEARALAPMRAARLKSRLSMELRLDNLAAGEVVALGWACESLCLAEAARTAGPRVLVLDFEKFLIAPHQALGSAFVHLGVRVPDSEIAAILSGSETRSYSKAPEHAYDVATRNAVLAESRTRFASEIRQGLRWIERAAANDPALGPALRLFA